MKLTGALATAIVALPPAAAHAGTPYYEATLTGTFASVDFDGADPGAFADLNSGDTYVFTFRADATPHTIGPGTAIHEILSAALSVDDGVALMSIGPASGGDLYVQAVPDQSYLFAIRQVFEAPPFGSVRFALLDSDGDPVLTSSDLPLTLDLDAFTRQRGLALIGEIETDDGSLFPIAHASVDAFSARIVPAPGFMTVAALAAFGPLRRRSRKP